MVSLLFSYTFQNTFQSTHSHSCDILFPEYFSTELDPLCFVVVLFMCLHTVGNFSSLVV
jgi:hypothetical protein